MVRMRKELRLMYSVAFEYVAGVDAGRNIGEGRVIAVGEDGAGEALELGKVVDDFTAEEC